MLRGGKGKSDTEDMERCLVWASRLMASLFSQKRDGEKGLQSPEGHPGDIQPSCLLVMTRRKGRIGAGAGARPGRAG